MKPDYQLEDSGKREVFDGGAIRDVRTGKGRFDLITPVGLRRLAVVYEKGAVKYSPRNWEKGMPVGRCIDSALRHINCYLAGSTEEDHLAQAAWNLFTAMHFEEQRPELNDIRTRMTGAHPPPFTVATSTTLTPGWDQQIKDIQPIGDLRRTLGLDLDGVLAELDPARGSVPSGRPQLEAIPIIRAFKDAGWQIILFTVRPDEHAIREWCDRHFAGLIDSINCNPDDILKTGICTPKPHADVYLDDRAWPNVLCFDWEAFRRDAVARGWISG